MGRAIQHPAGSSIMQGDYSDHKPDESAILSSLREDFHYDDIYDYISAKAATSAYKSTTSEDDPVTSTIDTAANSEEAPQCGNSRREGRSHLVPQPSTLSFDPSSRPAGQS